MFGIRTLPVVLTTSTPTGRARAGRFSAPPSTYASCRTTRRVRSRVSTASGRAWRSSWRPSFGPTSALCRPGEGSRGVRERAAHGEIRAAISPARRLFRDTVAASALIAAQTSEDAERFIAVGADPARTRVVGNMKFDMRLGALAVEEGSRAAAKVPWRQTGLDRRKHPCRRGGTGARRARAAPARDSGLAAAAGAAASARFDTSPRC